MLGAISRTLSAQAFVEMVTIPIFYLAFGFYIRIVKLEKSLLGDHQLAEISNAVKKQCRKKRCPTW